MQKKKRTRKPKEPVNPNLIKTSNKLIGDIENKEIYDSDDAFEQAREQLFPERNQEYLGQNIDLGEVKKEKKELN